MAAIKVETTPTPPTKPPKERMSLDEFLAWADEDVWAEWENGEVKILSPASYKHQNIVSFLVALIRLFMQERDLGIVLTAPFAMHLPKSQRVREPDLLVVLTENLDRIKSTHLEGPADLVIEIVSEESLLQDRGTKMAEYELDGVREYWLVDPERKQVDFFVLGEGGGYDRKLPDASGVYRSVVLEGFKLKVEWLWQERLPKVSEALRFVRRKRK